MAVPRVARSIQYVVIVAWVVSASFCSRHYESSLDLRNPEQEVLCVPDCVGRDCGNDGCGGMCGNCEGPEECLSHRCVCVPGCIGRNCGPDGCGSLCGSCPCPSCEVSETACSPSGICVCAPDCEGRVCGPDGCGGLCGSCPCLDCAPEETMCLDDGSCVCLPDCQGRECGPDACSGTCGNCPCPECTLEQGTCAPSGRCVALLDLEDCAELSSCVDECWLEPFPECTWICGQSAPWQVVQQYESVWDCALEACFEPFVEWETCAEHECAEELYECYGEGYGTCEDILHCIAECAQEPIQALAYCEHTCKFGGSLEAYIEWTDIEYCLALSGYESASWQELAADDALGKFCALEFSQCAYGNNTCEDVLSCIASCDTVLWAPCYFGCLAGGTPGALELYWTLESCLLNECTTMDEQQCLTEALNAKCTGEYDDCLSGAAGAGR
jgi:hypothetical protein